MMLWGRGAGPGEVRLRLAGLYDLWRYDIAASDPDAQRWLGWNDGDFSPAARTLDRRHLRRADEAGPRVVACQTLWLAAVARSTYVGGVSLTPSAIDSGGRWRKESTVIGAVVVPALRRQGFGTSLFARGAAHAHDALGVTDVLAGCEDGNDASALALRRAGYEQIDGPAQHTLPNGRVIGALWFLHRRGGQA